MKPLSEKKRFELTRRLAPLFLLLLIFLGVVLARVLYLQMVQGEKFKKLSAVNRITHETVPAPRGSILDCQGRVLAADQPVFQLVKESLSPASPPSRLTELARLLQVDTSLIARRLNQGGKRYVLRSLTDEQRIRFEEKTENFPGLKINNYPRRVYRQGKIIGPVIGYTGEISSGGLKHRRREGLSQGDIVGKAGIEKKYDSYLRGEDGIKWVETTATGEYIRTLSNPASMPPQQGNNLTLNLDLKLQQLVARSFPADSQGVAVVLKLPNGELKALYSQPSYDPNIFVKNEKKRIDKLLQAGENPLLNRALQSRFPPGSTFKIIPFLAALRADNYSPTNTFNCPGYFWLGRRKFRCWEERGHGRLNLYNALIHSCNVHFYKLVRELGFEPVKSMARQLNFGQKTGIDLPDEKKSQLSTAELARNKYGSQWTEGEELNAIVGQGYTLVTPIKQAVILATILTGRQLVPAVASLQSGQTRGKFSLAGRSLKSFKDTLDRVTEEGTGYWAQHTPDYQRIEPDLLGKTGTVQKAVRKDGTDTPPSDAWFVSAAPADLPEYVVVVFLGSAGSAGHSAAPMVRKIYQKMEKLNYFSRPSKNQSARFVPIEQQSSSAVQYRRNN